MVGPTAVGRDMLPAAPPAVCPALFGLEACSGGGGDNDDLENTTKKEHKQRFFQKARNRIGATILAGALALFSVGACSKIKDDDGNHEQYYTHEATVSAKVLQDGSASTGTVTLYGVSTGKTYTGTLGSALTLDKTTSKTEKYNITITENGKLERRFLSVPITSTTIDTDVADTTKLDVSGLLSYVLFDGKNRSWEPRTIKVIFNPDTDGNSLPSDIVSSIEQAISDVQSWSKRYGTEAYITGVSFDENGTKDYNSIPPEGEIWVFKELITSGASNVTYPSGGSKVSSSKIAINTGSSTSGQAYQETLDALIDGEQNVLGGYSNIGEWFRFMFWRPRGDNSVNYSVNSGYESQTGIDSFAEVTARAMRAEDVESYSVNGVTDPMSGTVKSRTSYVVQPEEQAAGARKSGKAKAN